MWSAIISNWLSYGGARCRGALSWKGTLQDCIDHLRQKHSVPSSVKLPNLGPCFPPWMVMREVWRKTLMQQVSGVSTDVLLFSEHGSTLVHHYRVLARERHTHPCEGSLWPNFGHLLSGLRPKPSTTVGMYPSGILRQWFWIHCAAFDSDIWTMNLPSVKLVGRCPRSCRKCLLVPHPQRPSGSAPSDGLPTPL